MSGIIPHESGLSVVPACRLKYGARLIVVYLKFLSKKG